MFSLNLFTRGLIIVLAVRIDAEQQRTNLRQAFLVGQRETSVERLVADNLAGTSAQQHTARASERRSTHENKVVSRNFTKRQFSDMASCV